MKVKALFLSLKGCFDLVSKQHGTRALRKLIFSAFKKTGLWPFNPSHVLKIVTLRPITSLETSSEALKTSKTSKSIRQFQKDYLKNPTRAKLEMLFRVNESLAAASSIQEHRANGLEKALDREKKKRQRDKRLGLTGKEV